MPISVYLDGSGTHPNSDLLTLSACVIADEIVHDFTARWNEALVKNGTHCLHMRTLNDPAAPKSEPLLCDLLNVLGHYRSEFFYFRICTVVMKDYADAKATMPLLKSAEAMCVDFCTGGLWIPDGDGGKHNTIRVWFDRNEPFMRHVHRIWTRARSRGVGGWPRQVAAIEKTVAGHPGMQAADLFAWTVNRHLRQEDQDLLATSAVIAINHASRIYDFRTICGMHDASGRRLPTTAPDFEPTMFRMRFR